MKSAYELAMERMEKEQGKGKSLSDKERTAIADIDKKYEAKIAEKKLEYEPTLAQLQAAGAFDEVENVRKKMREEVAELEAARDSEKDAIWNKA